MKTPPPQLQQALKVRYSEPHRAYHVWAHIEAMLGHFGTHRDLAFDRTAILWAIYWHDAIYDPAAKDNERRSAELLRADAHDLLDPQTLDKSARFILATEKHELPDGLGGEACRDCALFMDFDLSILATPPGVFDAYERGVREEYHFVEEAMFRMGRRTILQRLLDRPSLYLTSELEALWEADARTNIRRSIAALSDSTGSL
jgi:predicted metal-dependent HD superfamily phosphohydrolase